MINCHESDRGISTESEVVQSCPAIQTTELSKAFNGSSAVDSLSLRVESGEIFGFLGPNGSGKSTTINLILDYVRPTNGSISVLGIDPQSNPRALREQIGVVPEDYGLYDRLTVREHIDFAIEMKRADVRSSEVLERVGLIDAIDKPAGECSKGMRQRLVLGMALVGDPALLILDEPTSGLDPNGVEDLREIIRAEANRGAAVFFSSHVLEQVEAICDRVGILRDGELIAVDTVDGLREAAGEQAALVVSVDEVPPDLQLTHIDGVEEVIVSNDSIRAYHSDSRVKAAVLNAVEQAGATVTDIGVEEPSLEEIFTEYTTGGDPR